MAAEADHGVGGSLAGTGPRLDDNGDRRLRRGVQPGGGRQRAGQHRAQRRSDETWAEETPKGTGGVAHTNLAKGDDR